MNGIVFFSLFSITFNQPLYVHAKTQILIKTTPKSVPAVENAGKKFINVISLKNVCGVTSHLVLSQYHICILSNADISLTLCSTY